ncbi:MAG: hypothetical protein Kow00108_13850 [Calditrichia bacterium]
MGFNPLTIIEKSFQKIAKKKTKSLIKSNIEDRINRQTSKEQNESTDLMSLTNEIDAEKVICIHKYPVLSCPFCPPKYSIHFGDSESELKHGWLVVLEGLQKGSYFPIYHQFETRIGTDRQCDCILVGSNIAPFHSSIYYNSKIQKFMIKDLSTDPAHLTYVNDTPVPYEGDGVPLVDHVKIKFGNQLLCRFKCILD